MYKIHLTRLATSIAQTKYSVEAVEQRARQELDALETDDPTGIMMHCFGMPSDAANYEFVCLPDGDGGIRVDTVSYEEGEELTSGPFKGKRLLMPIPDSDT